MEIQTQEVEVIENQLVPMKLTNYEELKKEIVAKVTEYKQMEVTEDKIKEAKDYCADLRKFTKAIARQRIDKVKEVEEKIGLNDYVNKCKELEKYVDDAVNHLDVQLKEFEKTEKDNKLQEILQYWVEVSGEYSELINVDKLVKKEWLNKTYSMTKVKQEIDHIIAKTKADIGTINREITDETRRKQAKIIYFENIDSPTVLSIALGKSNEMKEQAEKIDNVEKTIEKKEEVTQTTVETTTTTESEENKMIQFDFRVWATKAQLLELQKYLDNKNIKYGKVK